MPPKSPRKLPQRSGSLGQTVWDLPEARDVIFQSMRDQKWVVGLLLSKATFLEAVQALYHTFDHKDLRRLNQRKTCPSRHRLYLGSVRRLRCVLFDLSVKRAALLELASTPDWRQSFADTIDHYPNVVDLFWDGNMWEYYSLRLPSQDLSLEHRPIAEIETMAVPIFHCSHKASPGTIAVPEWHHVHWSFDPSPFLPQTWEVRRFSKTVSAVHLPDPPYRWLSWTHDSVIELLADMSRIKIGALSDGLDLTRLLRHRATVEGAARLIALDAPAVHLDGHPLEVRRDLAVQDLRMLHIPFSPRTPHLHYPYCYYRWGHPDVWCSYNRIQARIPGVLELCMVHPAFVPTIPRQPILCPAKTFPTASHVDLTVALEKAKLYKKPWYWSRPDHFPGRMKKIHVQLLIPLRLPDMSKALRRMITTQLFECISPTRDEVARMLAAGGPKCEYRLSATFFYSPSKEETEVSEVLSTRLMEALSQHRADIEAKRGNTKAKPRWRL